MNRTNPMSKQQRRKAKPTKPFVKLPAAAKLEIFYPYKKTVCFGMIAALAFVLYVNTLWNQYALDDAIVITQNQFTQQGFKGIGNIMTSDVFLGFFKTEKNLVAGGRYRPLSVVTFAIEHQLFGENPGVSHFINLLLYALTGIVLFICIQK